MTDFRLWKISNNQNLYMAPAGTKFLTFGPRLCQLVSSVYQNILKMVYGVRGRYIEFILELDLETNRSDRIFSLSAITGQSWSSSFDIFAFEV